MLPQVAYGANIAAFPAGGWLHVSHLTDVAGKGAGVPGNYAAFGVAASGKGKVAVFSDTNCLDSSHNVSVWQLANKQYTAMEQHVFCVCWQTQTSAAAHSLCCKWQLVH
jgi:hypothetical protein